MRRIVLSLAGGVLVACGSGEGGDAPGEPTTPAGDFVLTLGAPAATTLQGAPGQVLVKVERRNGFTAEVLVDLVDAPAGVTSTAAVVNGSTSALLGITVGDGVALGELNLTVAASAGGKTSRASLKVTVQPPQPATGELISTALAAGRIDLGASLLYRAYALYGDRRLPQEYVGAGQSDEDASLFDEIRRNASALSTEVNDQLLAFTVRPTDPRSVFSARPAATVASANGRKRALAAPVNTNSDKCTTGTEEWISRLTATPAPGLRVWVLCPGAEGRNEAAKVDLDRVAEMVDRVMPAMTAFMKKPLVSDAGASENTSDGAVDLYILPTGVNTIPGYDEWATRNDIPPMQQFNGPTGKTAPVDVGKDPSYSATIIIPERAVRTSDFQINLIHELMHALQYARNGNLGGYWFSEASAVWASVHFPKVLDIRPADTAAEHVRRFEGGTSLVAMDNQYGFLRRTGGLLELADLAPYSSYVWPLFMEQVSDAGSIARAWERLATVSGSDVNQASDALNSVLAFEPNFRKFALRNVNREFLPGDPLPGSQRYKASYPQFPFPTRLPKNLDRGPIDKTTDKAYKLFEPLAPLAAGYYVFDVAQSDPALKQVQFDLEGARLTGLDIDALVKINGTWESAPRDLNGKTELRFCLDKPDEKVEEIWFIFSNHQRHVGQQIDPRFRAKGLQAPCASEIAGRSSSVLGARNATGAQFRLDATGVVWEQDPALSGANVAVYVPVRGIVALRMIIPGCTVTVDPPTYAIRPGDYNPLNGTGTGGSVTVNFNNRPATYGGGAGTMWLATVTSECADGSSGSGQALVGGQWFASPPGDGQTKESGTLIEGAFSEGSDDYNFKFTLIP